MIVRTNFPKYLKLQDVVNLEKDFNIYKTHKGTHILVINPLHDDNCQLFQPVHRCLEWKLKEGKKIAKCEVVFNSKYDNIQDIDMSKWNNQNQIYSYYRPDNFYM